MSAGIRVRSELAAIIASQEDHEAKAAKAKRELAYLQDVHLAVTLQRLDQQTLHAFLKTSVYISDAGDVCIMLHDQQLGEGWLGRAEFASAMTQQQLSLDSIAELHDQNSVFRFQLPTLCAEWTVQFALVYEPQYKVPAFVTVPASTHISSHHIDALDAIAPYTPSTSTAVALELPHLCEIWLTLPEMDPSARTSPSATLAQAQRLLYALLFENLSSQTHQHVSSIMVGDYTAEFCLLGTADCQYGATVMCVPEHSHLALRISSPNLLIYGAVVAAISERLMLLLNANSSTDLSHDTLSELYAKYAVVVGRILQGPTEPLAHPETDFALVECNIQNIHK